MRAFTRKPIPEPDALPAHEAGSELIVEDETDTLAPITATTHVRAAVVKQETEVSASATPSSLPSDVLDACHSLRNFVSADVPMLGWRRVVFVVTGVALRPGRAERELRVQVACLVDGVGSLVIDGMKEAAP